MMRIPGIPRERRRASQRVSFWLGSAALALLLGANVVAQYLPKEPNRTSLRHAPPHLGVLRALLWQDAARDTVVDMGFALPGQESGPTPKRVFTTRPSPVARLGQPWSYRPGSTQILSSFGLSGAPEGFSIDEMTGEVSGTPNAIGTFDVVVTGQLDDSRVAEHRFTLFVDDRWLPLGADGWGVNLVYRALGAARYTVFPGTLAVLVGVLGGTLLGAMAGYSVGFTRRVFRGLTLVVQSVPGLLLMFLGAAISGFSVPVLMVVVGVVTLPETAAGVFERVDALRRRDFVESARELGLSDRAILWNEIVWHNARGFVLSRTTQTFVYAILAEVTLSYMGLAHPNSTSLGKLLRDGRLALTEETSSQEAVVGLAMLLGVVAAFTLIERAVLRSWERPR